MNTTHLKKYAPQARRDFMAAVSQRLNQFGIHADNKGKLTASTPLISGSVMQIEGMSFDAGLARAREKLVKRAELMGFEALVEQMAYTWFNRLSAIRFMELHGYLDHNLRVLSSGEGRGARGESGTPSSRQSLPRSGIAGGLPGSSAQGSETPTPSLASGFRQSPRAPEGMPERRSFEILDHAQDVAADLGLDRNQIVELKLAGNQDEALYRQLLLGQCHQLHQAMPFLFEALDDETELLLPDNLTRTDSILRGLVDSIPEDDWQNVEIIGWLYQFYISEKKDQVIGSVVKSEDIPAATQLFTPNWIVKYLVQNSVGRQWLMTYPDSGLKAQMEYYIEPAEQEPSVIEALVAITPTSIDPETLKVLDPACGSGHILVEAYDILKAIYIERGYRVRDIPKLILENNLYGLDIDDRAAQLAGFALMMKARADDRRIFSRDLKLNVLAIQSTQHFFTTPQSRHSGMDCRNPDCMDSSELAIPGTGYPLPGGYDASNTDDDIEFKQLRTILALFEQAKTLGSLIQVPHEQAEYLRKLIRRLRELAEQGDSMQKQASTALLLYVQQAWLLAQQYDAVVANPPYMGSKCINPALKDYLKKYYKGFEKDLFSASIIRNLTFSKETSQLGFMTPFVWMFISTYEILRNKLINEATITSLIQPEYHAFFDSAFVPICAFTVNSKHLANYNSAFISLNDFTSADDQALKTLEAIKNPSCGWLYNAKPDDFKKIPGSPIAYSIDNSLIKAYANFPRLDSFNKPCEGLKTGENESFLRYWFEVNFNKIGYGFKTFDDFKTSGKRWLPHQKGGEYRRWYGNNEYVIKWENDGADIKKHPKSTVSNLRFQLKECATWTYLSSSFFGVRYSPHGFIFGNMGPMVVGSEPLVLTSFLCSHVGAILIKAINPTLSFSVGNVASLPYPDHGISNNLEQITCVAKECISISRSDWEDSEFSFDFISHPIIHITNKGISLESSFRNFEKKKYSEFRRMKNLEDKNNSIFVNLLGVSNSLIPEVLDEQITLTRPDQEKDIQRLISYAIGCMMGRYSLDEPGLIYAHAGNVDFDPSRYPSFPADEDGILPLTDQSWFKDDATNRFREFLLAVWGEDTLQQNLEFVAESLGLSSFKSKRGETSLDTVRRYLSSQFYKDHLQTYKKRPIYWLFSSGKQKAFECLVYLHRYNESTLARMRTEYVTPLLGKYSAYAEQLNQQMQDASSSEATRIKKDIQALNRTAPIRRQAQTLRRHAHQAGFGRWC